MAFLKLSKQKGINYLGLQNVI